MFIHQNMKPVVSRYLQIHTQKYTQYFGILAQIDYRLTILEAMWIQKCQKTH